MEFHTLAVAHAVPTLFLVGLIWFVQQVHYALYPAVGTEAFVAYERAHCRRITPVVLPMMLAELALAGAVCWRAPDTSTRLWALGGAVLLAVVWGATFLVQVPCHTILEQRADGPAMTRLLASNWVRTTAWTLRGVVAVRLLLHDGTR